MPEALFLCGRGLIIFIRQLDDIYIYIFWVCIICTSR